MIIKSSGNDPKIVIVQNVCGNFNFVMAVFFLEIFKSVFGGIFEEKTSLIKVTWSIDKERLKYKYKISRFSSFALIDI